MATLTFEETENDMESEIKFYIEMAIGRILSKQDYRMLLPMSDELSGNKNIGYSWFPVGIDFTEDVTIQAIDLQYGHEE